MPGYIDEAGLLVRRLLGAFADDPEVYQPVGVAGYGHTDFLPGVSLMRGFKGADLPDGTEVGMVNPYELIKKLAYPDDLGIEAAGRTIDSHLQKPYKPLTIPLYVRPAQEINKGTLGRRISTSQPDRHDGFEQILDVAGEAPNAIRTLLHESRHATQHSGLNQMPALRSISSYKVNDVDGRRLTDESRRYLARPDELLAYFGSVGDDFVKQHGRLLQSPTDAVRAVEMLDAGDALSGLHPLAKQMYVGSYRTNPTARQHINRVLMKYFAVPGAVAAGGALQDNVETGAAIAGEEQY